MNNRLINLDVVQDASNLFTAADALSGMYVCKEAADNMDGNPWVQALCGLGCNKPFYVDELTNEGVYKAHMHIRSAINKARSGQNDSYVGKYYLMDLLVADKDTIKQLGKQNGYVYERMMVAFRGLVQREFAACHGDVVWENRDLIYEHDWARFADINEGRIAKGDEDDPWA